MQSCTPSTAAPLCSHCVGADHSRVAPRKEGDSPRTGTASKLGGGGRSYRERVFYYYYYSIIEISACINTLICILFYFLPMYLSLLKKQGSHRNAMLNLNDI